MLHGRMFGWRSLSCEEDEEGTMASIVECIGMLRCVYCVYVSRCAFMFEIDIELADAHLVAVDVSRVLLYHWFGLVRR